MSNASDVTDATAHAATSTALTNFKTAAGTFLDAIDTALNGIGTEQKAVQIPDAKQDVIEAVTKVANSLVEG